MAEFNNPYNFIPTPPRRLLTGEFEDSPPKHGHDALPPDSYSGVVRVNMRTATDTVIVDAARGTQQGDHWTFPLRKLGGQPHIPTTSVKGMIRAAYEAITLSRMSVFTQTAQLGYRLPAQSGLDVVPFRVVRDDDSLVVRLLYGTNDEVEDYSQFAAWLSMEAVQRLGLDHGGPHKAVMELRNYQKGRKGFQFWLVTQIDGSPAPPGNVGNSRPSGERPIEVDQGWVHKTAHAAQKNFPRKHHERFFFALNDNFVEVQFDGDKADRLRERWQRLMADYREVAESATGRDNRAGAYQQREPASAWAKFEVGTQGYAVVEGSKLVDVQPVIISRRLFEVSPVDLALESDLAPATSLTDLSMADRVFGWVRQKPERGPRDGQDDRSDEDPAWRGRVAIGPVEVLEKRVSDGKRTLGILSTPKPSYARFYTAPSWDEVWSAGDRKDQIGYDEAGSVLRGRKVYPHRRDGGPPTGDAETGDQNRTIVGRILEDSTFGIDIRFEGLSAVEAGALLWLLDLDGFEDGAHYLRIGGAKPYGYGSVALAIDREGTKIFNAKALVERYRTGSTDQSREDVSGLVEAFKTAFSEATGSEFLRHPTIAAFLAAARGYQGDVFYPRTDEQARGRDPDKSYEWFVANERVIQGRSSGQALPALWKKGRLRTLSGDTRRGRGGQRRR